MKEVSNTEGVHKIIKYKYPFLYELAKNRVLFLMLVPGLLYLFVFCYLPMAGIFIAFKDINYAKGFFKSDWVGFKNFEFLFATPDVFVVVRNTVLYNIVFILLGNITAIFFAITLNELFSRRLAKFYQSVMFLPYFLSWVVVSYIVFAFLSIDMGFLNNFLKILGIQPVNWYFEKVYWPFILTGANIWKYAGYNSIVYLAAITGISNEYYDSAVIDGANKRQQVVSITIPMLSNLIIILVLLGVGRIFTADFGLFFQVPLDSGMLYPVTNVIDTYVYRALISLNDVGMSSAAGLTQSVVGFIMVLLSNYLTRKIDEDKALF